MGKDEIRNRSRQLVHTRQFHSVGNVLDNRLRTLQRSQALVVLRQFRTYGLVLHIAEWIHSLAYVVIQCTGLHQGLVRSDCTGGSGSQIHHLQRMLEGARRILFKVLEQEIGHIFKLKQARSRNEIEHPLHNVNERIAQDLKQRCSEEHCQSPVCVIVHDSAHLQGKEAQR